MSEEAEQIVGVLKRCTVCDEKTLHVDGVCQDHKIVRRRKARSAMAAARRAPAPAPPEPAATKKKSHPVRVLVSLIVVGGLIYLFGAVHVVHGDRSGLGVCWKASWTFANTLVDSDDRAAPRAALAQCGL